MKMKKIIFLIGIMMLMFSCTQIDMPEYDYSQSKIEFNLGDNAIAHRAKAQTRSIVSGTSFTEGNFGVYGYVTPSTYTTGGYIMQNAKYDAVTGDAAENSYYWPKADNNSNVNVKFVAYYPWDDANTTITNDEFVYSVSAPSGHNGTDVLYAIEPNVHPQEGRVALHFNHALAYIQFQAKKSSTVKSVQIKNIQFSSQLYTTGTITIPMTDATATTSVQNAGNLADFEFAQTTLKDNLTNDYGVLSNTVIVPQNVPAKVTITFDITLTNHDDLNNTDVDITYYNRTVTRDVIPNNTDANGTAYVSAWESGHKYIYRIYVTPDDVDFTATITDWTSTDFWQIWDEDTSSLDVF